MTSEAWRVLARNYARYDTPLRPNDATLTAIKSLIPTGDPLVVVLGATPIFGKLASRLWFVDAADEALQLVAHAAQQRTVHKNWLTAADEFAQADSVVGDGAINALKSPAVAEQLLRVLAAHRKPGSTLIQRVFLRHELSPDTFREHLTEAFAARQFSAVRFLVYGVVADASGLTAIADIDRYIGELETHLRVARDVADAYKAAYFEWRGMSPAEAATITTQAFYPSRRQIEAQLAAAGLRVSIVSAGQFPLAEFTPLYVSAAAG